uniref:Uncharacterized protein n=1 Tax=Octopus bimaculoides TaxID=37653 RepID=A0A0L8GXB9_OCTBM
MFSQCMQNAPKQLEKLCWLMFRTTIQETQCWEVIKSRERKRRSKMYIHEKEFQFLVHVGVNGWVGEKREDTLQLVMH